MRLIGLLRVLRRLKVGILVHLILLLEHHLRILGRKFLCGYGLGREDIRSVLGGEDGGRRGIGAVEVGVPVLAGAAAL